MSQRRAPWISPLGQSSDFSLWDLISFLPLALRGSAGRPAEGGRQARWGPARGLGVGLGDSGEQLPQGAGQGQHP